MCCDCNVLIVFQNISYFQEDGPAYIWLDKPTAHAELEQLILNLLGSKGLNDSGKWIPRG